jgi:hypothetical protein
VLSIAPNRTSRAGDSDVVSNEEFDVGDLIDPPVKDIEARNRHGIKSLLRLTGTAADPALFHHLVGGKDEFDAAIPLAALKSSDLVDLAGKIKRALEAKSRDADQLAETCEAKAAAQRNAADGLDLNIETDPMVLQSELEQAAGVKATLDEQARVADKAFSDAAQANAELAKLGQQAVSTQSRAELLSAAHVRQTFADAESANKKAEIGRLENALSIARAEYGTSLVTKEAARDAVIAAEESIAAAEQTAAMHTAWQKAIDDAANVSSPDEAQLTAAASAVDTARKRIEQAAVVRAAKERIGQSTKHQHEAAEHRLTAVHLRDAAKATDAVLSEAVASSRFSVDSDVLMAVLPTGERKPFFSLSDGERTMIAVAEKIERVRESEPDETKLGIIDLPQRTFQDLPDSVRLELARQAAARNICVVSAQVTDDKELTAEVMAV